MRENVRRERRLEKQDRWRERESLASSKLQRADGGQELAGSRRRRMGWGRGLWQRGGGVCVGPWGRQEYTGPFRFLPRP